MSFEPVQALKARRDEALRGLVDTVPYHRFLGVDFHGMGDELTGLVRYDDMLIGNATIPAINGGLEITAIMQLAWDATWALMESDEAGQAAVAAGRFPPMPKTVDLTIDYLRAGRPRDAYARAQVTKKGRRVANVRVEAWQDERARPIAIAHGHFLLPAGQGGGTSAA